MLVPVTRCNRPHATAPTEDRNDRRILDGPRQPPAALRSSVMRGPVARSRVEDMAMCVRVALTDGNGDEFRYGVQSVFLGARSPDCRGERHGRDMRETSVRLLLTSGGVTNPSIHDALVELLGKPIADSTALCIPTAQWGHPMCGPVSVRGFVSGVPPW